MIRKMTKDEFIGKFLADQERRKARRRKEQDDINGYRQARKTKILHKLTLKIKRRGGSL